MMKKSNFRFRRTDVEGGGEYRRDAEEENIDIISISDG